MRSAGRVGDSNPERWRSQRWPWSHLDEAHGVRIMMAVIRGLRTFMSTLGAYVRHGRWRRTAWLLLRLFSSSHRFDVELDVELVELSAANLEQTVTGYADIYVLGGQWLH